MSDDLRQRYADAIKAAAVNCDGNCGRTEQECADHVELVWAGTARQDRPDEVTWVQGTTTALADVMRAVRDTELETAREEAAYSREALNGAEHRRQEWRERAEKAEAALAALTERSQTRDHLADREQELARLRLAHLEKEVVLYADTNRLIEAELETARTKFAALDALHPHTELNWWHPCKNHSITDEEPTLAACPNCLIEPVMGCPRCGDDDCEIRAILHPDSPKDATDD